MPNVDDPDQTQVQDQDPIFLTRRVDVPEQDTIPKVLRKVKAETKPKLDIVKSPKHYVGALASKLDIEVIDIANALNLNGNRFSILRYVCRAGLKDSKKEIEDLQKIAEYVDFEIRRLRGEPISNTARKNKITKNLLKGT